MRVLTLVDAFRLGGAETLLASLSKVSRQAGFEMEVVSLTPPSEERSKLAPLLEGSGLKLRYLNVRRTVDPAAIPALTRVIRESGCDVVHAHLEMAMTLGVPAARLAGRRAVSTFHHVRRPLSGRAAARERLAVEVASAGYACVFVSSASRRSFAEKYKPRREPASWTTVHNGIDLSRFTPGQGSMPSDLPVGSGPVVTIVAALRDFKGIQHGIAAWPAVRAKFPDATLLIVGSGTEEQDLRARVAELGVQDSVVFAGMRMDVVPIMQSSDVMLLPSIYGENLPTVLMEAGACERPVVASRIGGIPDIVAHGETGLLTPPADPAAIAEAISTLLGDEALRRRMGVAARARVEEKFDALGWARRLLDIYHSAAAGGPRDWKESE